MHMRRMQPPAEKAVQSVEATKNAVSAISRMTSDVKSSAAAKMGGGNHCPGHRGLDCSIVHKDLVIQRCSGRAGALR